MPATRTAIDITGICQLRRMRRASIRVLQGIAIAGCVLAPSVAYFGLVASLLMHIPPRPTASLMLMTIAIVGAGVFLISRSAERGNVVCNAIIAGLAVSVLAGLYYSFAAPVLDQLIFVGLIFALLSVFALRGVVAAIQLRRAARVESGLSDLLSELDSQPASPRVPIDRNNARAAAWTFQLSAAFGWFIAYVVYALLSAIAFFVDVSTIVKIPVSLAICSAAGLLYRRALRIATLRTSELRARDPRPPVLFLRAFADDNVQIRRIFRWQNVLAGFRTGFTLERAVVDAASSVGPVIAIGRPGERLSPVGAARDYLPPKADWKAEVARLAAESAAIVAIAGNTPGILWEYGHLAREALFSRLVFVFPPSSGAGTAARHDLLADAAQMEPLLDAASRKRHLLAAIVDPAGESVIVESAFRDEESYAIAVKLLMRRIAIPASSSSIAERRLLPPRPMVTATAMFVSIVLFFGIGMSIERQPASADTVAACIGANDALLTATWNALKAQSKGAEVLRNVRSLDRAYTVCERNVRRSDDRPNELTTHLDDTILAHAGCSLAGDMREQKRLISLLELDHAQALLYGSIGSTQILDLRGSISMAEAGNAEDETVRLDPQASDEAVDCATRQITHDRRQISFARRHLEDSRESKK